MTSGRAEVTEGRTATRRPSVLRRLVRDPLTVVGLVIVTAYLVGGVFAPWLAPYDPVRLVGASLQAPTIAHPFGTDSFGRDILSRILFGIRPTLEISLAATVLAASLGLAAGLVAGFYGGWVDAVIMRLADMLLAFPALLLALTIVALLGPSPQNVALSIAIVYIPQFARVIRGVTLSLVEQEFVTSARALGAPAWAIMVRHLLLNLTSPLIVQMSLTISLAVLYESALSFLGMGPPPPAPSLGLMVSNGSQVMELAPWGVVFPAVAIALLILGLNILGDAVRDELDPRGHER